MMNFRISCRDLSVLFHGRRFFERVNFSARSGEAWLIYGEPGSGKTAFLEAIAGKWPMISGEVSLEAIKAGNNVEVQPEMERILLRMVSAKHSFKNLSNTSDHYYQQRYNSYDSGDSQTVRAHLETIFQTEPSSVSISDLSSLLKIENLLDEELIKLSNGETKKVLLASALVGRPNILLLDNFFAGIDAESRKYFDCLFESLVQNGMLILLASSLKMIPSFIQHIAVLKDESIKTQTREQFESVNTGKVSNEAPRLDMLSKLVTFDLPQFQNIVEMRAVKVVYEGKKILHDINWVVKQGERWALTGPNGSGKTTLLSLISGDNPQAYANHISLFDRKRGSGESIWDIKRLIGFVSPELHQYFPTEITCGQVIESGFYDTLGLFRQSKVELATRCSNWAELLDLSSVFDRRLSALTYSQQRQTLLARALVKNPALLILDEPFQGFDEKEIEILKTLLDKISELCLMTMIFVSHYETEIPGCVAKRIELKDGMVKYIGDR